MALKTKIIPREDIKTGEGNEAAREATEFALSTQPVEGKHLVRLRKRQLEPDANQPRRRKRPEDVRRRRESLRHDGQQAAVEAYPTGKTNRYGEPVYRLTKGEMRWLGTDEGGVLDAVILTKKLTPEEIETSQVVENVDHNDFDLAELCRIAWKFKNVYNRDYKFIADGILNKYAKGDPEWVGDRARIWKRLLLDENYDAKGLPSQAVERLMADNSDTFTHVQAIVSAPQDKWVSACKMVENGATVAAVKSYLFPEKAKPVKKETVPSKSGGGGITTHRVNTDSQGTPAQPQKDVFDKVAENLKQIAAEPLSDEDMAEVNSDWFGGEPVVTAQELANRFDQIVKMIERLKEQGETFKKSPEYTPIAAHALRQRARNIAVQLRDEVAGLFN